MLLSRNIKIKIYRNVTWPLVLYGCETWSLTLREECRLRVLGAEEEIWLVGWLVGWLVVCSVGRSVGLFMTFPILTKCKIPYHYYKILHMHCVLFTN
jgi:hypothetical protein